MICQKELEGNTSLLSTRKNQANHPIYHVDVLAGSSSRTYLSDDTWVRINQDTNEGAGGSYVYICYKEAP